MNKRMIIIRSDLCDDWDLPVAGCWECVCVGDGYGVSFLSTHCKPSTARGVPQNPNNPSWNPHCFCFESDSVFYLIRSHLVLTALGI